MASTKPTAPILVVDDDLGTIGLFSAFLTSEGYAVASACTVTDGFAIACSRPCGLILSDPRLPDAGLLFGRFRASSVASSQSGKDGAQADRLGADCDRDDRPDTDARVLWVDDQLDASNDLVRMVATFGYAIDVVQTGTEALRRARRIDYDVFLLDLKLPDMGGLDVLRQLRESGRDSPAILVTGFATVEAMAAAMPLQAASLLQKPVFYEDVLGALQLALIRRVSPANDANPYLNSHLVDGLAALRQLSSDNQGPAAEAALVARALRSVVGAIADPQPLTSLVSCATVLRAMLEAGSAGSIAEQSLSLLVTFETLRQPADRDVERALKILSESTEVLLKKAVAASVGLSSNQLGRMIQRHTGVSFRDWRILLRLRPLIGELTSSDEHVGQLAFAVGYEHASQVDRDFEKWFGTPPSRFRRLFRVLTCDIHA